MYCEDCTANGRKSSTAVVRVYFRLLNESKVRSLELCQSCLQNYLDNYKVLSIIPTGEFKYTRPCCGD